MDSSQLHQKPDTPKILTYQRFYNGNFKCPDILRWSGLLQRCSKFTLRVSAHVLCRYSRPIRLLLRKTT